MGSEYKRIILLKGLELINDYQFSIVKSLLAHDLGLTTNMQEEYNKVKIADLMEKKFPGAACVDKLIDLFKDMPPLKDIVKQLRNEKMKEETPKKKKQQAGAGPAACAPTTSRAVTGQSAEGTATSQKRRTAAKGTAATKKNKVSLQQTEPVCPPGASTSAARGFLPRPQASLAAAVFPCFCPTQNQTMKGRHQAAPRGRVLQQGPLTVLVLKATEPFEYESPEEGRNRMFHATVATCNQFFHVKVLNSNLKEKFTKENIITVLDYYECKGILEINKTSSVYEADPFQVIEVPNSIIKRANETPKIDNLYKQASGTFVYGLFLLHEKKVNRKTTVYEIQDNTGTMEVVGTERWHNIKCEKGDKLRLFGFQLKTIDQKLKLTCGTHSFIQKKKKETTQNDESKRTQPTQEQSQLLEPSVTSTQSTWSYPQTPQMPPPTPGSSSSTKKKKIKTTQNDESKRMQPPQGQSQLPGPSVTITQSPWSYPQTPPMPPPTPGSRSSTKKKKIKTTQNDESKRMQPPQGQSQLPGPSVTITQSPWSYPQTPPMPPPTPGSRSSTKKPRLKVVPRAPSIEEGFQKGPKEVMVLRATEPFAYDLMEAERKMFHATVATESQFFQVKVFHVNLKEKFIPKKVIAISDYYGRNGFLEVYNAACVSDVNADRKMEISSRLIQNANATPKINSLYSQEPGTFVSGIYQVHKKNVLNEHIIWYEIQDETGKMEVLVYGRLTKVNCEEGDKLKLICFELSAEPRQLRSVIHSFIKV
ncbi:hypothetical protein PANDA_017077, partial [Ailuropoda melanoleuca]